MTTGTRISDLRTPFKASTGGTWSLGPYRARTWSGGNSIASKKKIPSRPRRLIPPRPDTENRLPNEDVRHFRARVGAALVQWYKVRQEILDESPRKPKAPPTKRVMPANNYTLDVRDSCYAVATYKQKGGGSTIYSQIVGRAVPSHVALLPQDHYHMIQRLRRKAYGSGFHPGIFAAEAPKAIEMIFDASKQLRLGLVSLAKGNWRGIIRNLGRPTEALYGRARYSYLSFQEGKMSLSQAWLAFQYGWKPLIGDLEDGAAYIAYAIEGQGASLGRRVSTRKTFERVSKDTPGSGNVAFCFRKTTHQVQYVINDVKTSGLSKLPSLASAAAVAWEILPYSFVCDWVVPIGSYLQALRTSAQLTGTVVVSVKSDTTFTDVRSGTEILQLLSVEGPPPRERLITFTRSVSTELSPPTPLGDLSPSSILPDWKRSLNAVALLSNLKIDGLDLYGFKKIDRS